MRDPTNRRIKAWAKEYEETPFFFEQDSGHGKRLVAWSENPEQIEPAFYAILESFPATVEVLLKVAGPDFPNGRPSWSRFHARTDKTHLWQVIKESEDYVFSDGMHQLCVKDTASGRYVAFDEHGIFFIYSPTPADADLFSLLGFQKRYAEPLYRIPHFQKTLPGSEVMEARFVKELDLQKANSELD